MRGMSVNERYQCFPQVKKERGGGRYNLSIRSKQMTASKETKLGKGGGEGGAPWYPPLGETLGTDWYRSMRRGINVVEEWRMYQKESLGCVNPVTSRFLRSAS